MTTPRQPVSPETAYARAAARCATTECCRADVTRKLTVGGLTPGEARAVVERLVAEGFIDEERYVRAYVHDKVAFSHDGPLKIRQGLLAKRLPADLVDEALAAVEPETWGERLATMLRQKNRSLKADSTYERRLKLLRFAAGRGYDADTAMRTAESVADEDF